MLLSVLGVIGLVLKWILWIVLGILGLILLILLIVLLNPLTYKVQASRREIKDPSPEEEDRLLLGGLMEAHVKVTWFFHLLRIQADFVDKKLNWSAKLAWKKVAGSEEEALPSTDQADAAEAPAELPDTAEEDLAPSEDEAASSTQSETETETSAEAEPEAEPKMDVGTEAESEVEPEPTVDQESEAAAESEQKTEPEQGEESEQKTELEQEEDSQPKTEPEPNQESKPEPAEEPAPKPSLDERIDEAIRQLDRISDALWDLPDKVDTTIEKKLEPVEKLWKKFDAFYDKDKALKAVLKLVKRELKPLLPKRVRAEFDWGTGDPYLTSKIMGYQLALAAFLFPKKSRKRTLSSNPVLMDRKLDFSLSMSDWFLLGGFIPPVIAALLNIHIWHLIKFVRNLKK